MKREYPERPIVGVGAVIIRDQKMLLVKRGVPPNKGKWSIPGGAVDVGEPHRAALVREVKEECGLDIEVGELIDVIDLIELDAKNRVKYHYVVVDYRAHLKDGAGRLKVQEDISDARFVPLEKIRDYDITDSLSKLIERMGFV